MSDKQTWLRWQQDTLAEKTVSALEKNHFTATYVKTCQEAKDLILSLIPDDAAVGIGGSATVKELDLDQALEAKTKTIYDHNKPGLTPEETVEFRRKQLTCDVFLTSTNAVTLDGKLVNTDGSGNRVAAMIFGPKQVIVVAGVNKIVSHTHEGYHRIKMIAAPLNNKRLNRPNPCTKTGMCMDCQAPTRICNVTTILHKQPPLTPIHVIIVGENLGF